MDGGAVEQWRPSRPLDKCGAVLVRTAMRGHGANGNDDRPGRGVEYAVSSLYCIVCRDVMMSDADCDADGNDWRRSRGLSWRLHWSETMESHAGRSWEGGGSPVRIFNFGYRFKMAGAEAFATPAKWHSQGSRRQER